MAGTATATATATATETATQTATETETATVAAGGVAGVRAVWADRAEVARLAALGEQLQRQAGDLAAAEYRWLRVLEEFDRGGGWGVQGARSCAHWLSWACGIGGQAARERVRVARALPGLPRVCAAFAAGRLTYAKVRAITRVATASNEETLVGFGLSATAAQLERIVREQRRVEQGRQAHAVFERRGLRWWVDEDGVGRLVARLPAEELAVVVAAVEALMDGLGEDAPVPAVDPAGGGREQLRAAAEAGAPEAPVVSERWDVVPVAARRADALRVMAETVLATGPAPAPDRHRVVVQVRLPDAQAPDTQQTRPPAAEAVVGEPDDAGPAAAEPVGAEPVGAEPRDAQPAADPAAADPAAAESVLADAEPVDDESIAEPVGAEPVDTEPVDTEPVDTGPGGEPVVGQPPSGEPAGAPVGPEPVGGEAVGGARVPLIDLAQFELAWEQLQGRLVDGTPLASETVRRLACDAEIVALVEDALGTPLGVGRESRRISRRLRRALQHRDRGCRFPGCTVRRFVDGHHVVFWGDGGPTTLENVLLLCRFHHRLVHEAGYRISAQPGQRFTFYRPDGTVIPDAAPPVAGDPTAPARANAAAGITVTPSTTLPDWDGSPPDYDTTLLVLAQHSGQDPPTSAGPPRDASAVPPGQTARPRRAA